MVSRAVVHACAVLIVLLGGSAIAGPMIETGEEAERLIVQSVASTPMDLQTALEHVGGKLIREDERLDMAVVSAPMQRLSLLLPGHVMKDGQIDGASQKEEGEAQAMGSDPKRGFQWALDHLDMDSAWDLETGSRDVTVAVVDSGVDPDHEDLAGVPLELRRDYVAGGTVNSDPHGHGTHISGILAAGRSNNIGIAGMAEISLMNVRVLDENNKGWCSDFLSGTQNAINAEADIINLSLSGLVSCMLPSLRTNVATSDTLIVASAGNNWPDLVCLEKDPALDPFVIAVTAIDDNGDVAYFSCRSPYAEIAAPGVSVLSTFPGDRYASWSGTSMAAPHVAATAALMKSANPDLTAQQLRALLIETADDSMSTPWDPGYGHGVVDPTSAIEAAILLDV